MSLVKISFLELMITVSGKRLETTLHIKSTDRHQYFMLSHAQNILSAQLFSAKH